MVALYITEPRSTLRLDGESLLVTCQDGGASRRDALLRIDPLRLELIGLVGTVHVTCQATQRCLDCGIDLAWFSRQGKLRGRLVVPQSRSIDLRMAQYTAWQDPAQRLHRARQVLSAKIGNAVGLLLDIQSNYPGPGTIAAAIAELKVLRQRLAEPGTLAELLGLEGLAAKAYFNAYGSAFRGELRFTQRQRRPPPDPVNALLSFGYTLLGERIASLVEARGFDPAIGFLHEPRAGRASLALDLLEELRHPLVDRFVLRICNLRTLRPEMFEAAPQPGGVCLTKTGLKRFFEHWEQYLLRPLRETGSDPPLAALSVLQRQVERLAADLRGRQPYLPFCMDG